MPGTKKKVRIPLLVIVGPTAVGKSEVALEVADMLNGEIISGDSMQVYRGMDIGTAKLKPEQRFSKSGKYIPHHLLDILDPNEEFSVAQFQKEVERLARKIWKQGRLPLLVGGTGLYINAVIASYQFPQVPKKPQIREKLKAIARKYGSRYLHEMLNKVDPISASRIHPHDQRRLIRALEVFYILGIQFSSISGSKENSNYTYKFFGLTLERKKLYQYIEKRVDRMIAQGFIREVRALLASGYNTSLKPFQSIGYRHIISYLEGEHKLEKAIQLMKQDTRRLAKKQYTWFSRNSEIYWIDVDQYPSVQEVAQKIASVAGRTFNKNVENF